MLKSFVVFGRFILFWTLFFLLERIIFLIYFADRIKDSKFSEIVLLFLHGLRLDASMIAYLGVIPLLTYCLLLFIKGFRIPVLVGKIYMSVFIVSFSIINAFNINLYREWGSKINYRALEMAFESPKQAFASGSSSPILLSASILIFTILAGLLLSKYLVDFRIKDLGKPWPLKAAFTFISIAVCGLAVRGGWQLTPANQSMAYYSTNTLLNHTALNTQWNLIHDIVNNKYSGSNPYNYYSIAEARKIVDELFPKTTAKSPQVLTQVKPNVVLIILESFTAEFVESMGGEKGINPEMEKLIDQGILFDQIYAAAGRTDKGLTATLSGFPSQAIRSIMKENAKQEKLPGIAQDFLSAGYSTSFYYGGESEFFNMKSYLLGHGYQKLIDQHSFAKKDMNSKWGAFDEKVFEKNISDFKAANQPFFSTILTLTNHEPFELPGKFKFPGDQVENKFRSTAAYTDSCLGAYITEARKQAWYKNTLFVVLADHSHRLPRSITEYDPDRYRIPLLFFGEVLKPEYKGTRINKIGNQTDLAATLLSQIGLKSDRFTWSKDLLNPETREFGFFNWDNGFGFALPGQVLSFDNIGKNIILREKAENKALESQMLRYGKAYMQLVFEEYRNY